MITWKTYLWVCKEHFKKSQTDFDLTLKIPPRSEQLKIKIKNGFLKILWLCLFVTTQIKFRKMYSVIPIISGGLMVVVEAVAAA